jgi:hypothetical protein
MSAVGSIRDLNEVLNKLQYWSPLPSGADAGDVAALTDATIGSISRYGKFSAG